MPDESTQFKVFVAGASYAGTGCCLSKSETIAPQKTREPYRSPMQVSWSTLAAARALKSDIDRDKGNLTLTLKELCKAFQVSEREMRRTFKRLYQVAPREYQCRARIEHAVKVLANNPVASIDELAVQLGYADRADFAKCFKKRVGIAPGEYRLCARRNHAAEF